MILSQKVKVEITRSSDIFPFWEKSKQRTIFNNPKFLEIFDYKFFWWTATFGDEKICCWPICIDKDRVVIPDFFYYFGPLWSAKLIRPHKWLNLSNNIYNKIFEKLIKEYGEIDNQLHYSLDDVRAFDWWNYDLGKKFQIIPKYSATLENLNSRNLEQVTDDFRYIRKREIKKFNEKYRIKIENDLNFKTISFYYSSILKQQEKEVTNQNLTNLHSIYKAIKNKFGSIIVLKNSDNNEIISFSLVLDDLNTSNLVFNANNKKYRKDGSNAVLIKETIGNTQKKKLNILDFNGVNSPKRGDDKHSFGSRHKLYFHVKY